MKFYNRELELSELRALWKQTEAEGKLAILTGRRRLGKTLLATEFVRELPFIYFFVEKKNEALLCSDLLLILRERLPFPIVGEIKRFKDILILLFEYAIKERFVLIIDEFQEFYNINPAVYSEMQNLWDYYRVKSKILLIAVGSVYSLMHKIFEDKKEPLFGRADRSLKLESFSISTLATLLKDHSISDPQQVFFFYVLTGAIPKYLDLLMTNDIHSKEQILDFMLREFSPLLQEGKHLLIEEFGNEYGTYFSILELMSLGKTSRSEIESILERDIGGYLARLETTYDLIYRRTPFDAKPAGRLVKFAIKDPFLNFWFRFIYRNWSAVELKNFTYIRNIVDRDFSQYCGRFLEQLFVLLLSAQKMYNRIGTYWEAKNLNEIDLVAVNDLEKRLLIADVKMNPKKLNIFELQMKAKNLVKNYKDYHIDWIGLSPENIQEYLCNF